MAGRRDGSAFWDPGATHFGQRPWLGPKVSQAGWVSGDGIQPRPRAHQLLVMLVTQAWQSGSLTAPGTATSSLQLSPPRALGEALWHPLPEVLVLQQGYL